MIQKALILFIMLLLPAYMMQDAAAKTPRSKAKATAEKKEPEAVKEPEIDTVTLQGLNKVTGSISRLEGPIGTVLNFGRLEIIVRRCWTAPPEERPETAALMEIRELKPGEGPNRIFLGWMFASSPGLSGLEHPVYDISILSCELHGGNDTQAALPEKTKPAAKKEAPVEKSKIKAEISVKTATPAPADAAAKPGAPQ